MERFFFKLEAPEFAQTSSRAALPESGSQEKRSNSCLTIGRSCEVYPKVGGRLRLFSLFWDRISSDQWIRDAVRGYKIEFKRDPVQYKLPNKMPFSREEKECISVEVEKLLGKGAIRRASFVPNQFLSNLFTIPKKGGELRPVINLKPLNHFAEYHHFKMEGLSSLLDLIRSNDYMITMDLKDAYLSVPIHADHSKYLRFEWESHLWEFTCLPFGLSSAPRAFTKVMKHVIGKVRSQGIRSVIYLDDLAVLSRSFDQSNLDSQFVIKTLQSVGFLINWEKSVLKPCQRIQFLGFTIDSSSTTVSLPQEKLNSLIERASATLHHSKRSIREVAEVIGLIVSSFPAIKLARLHYRHLEFSKFNALKGNLNDFDAACSLSQEAKDELEWFSNRCLFYNGTSIKKHSSVMVLTTDASQSGWGVTFENQSTNGELSMEEKKQHINWLELQTVLLGLQSFLSSSCGGNVI